MKYLNFTDAGFMKYILTLLVILQQALLCAQSDSVMLDAHFVFKNGIYSSFKEVLLNSPKYPDIEFDLKNGLQVVDIPTGFINDSTPHKTFEHDSVFAVVKKGKMFVNFRYDFHKIISLGSMSTFYMESSGDLEFEPDNFTAGPSFVKYYASPGFSQKSEVFYLNLKTGNIHLLNIENMEEVLKQDDLLYLDFSLASTKEKKQTLYSYLLRYNVRDPLYIKK